MNANIEKIRSDLFAFDFSLAEMMGIKTTANSYEKFSNQDWSESTDGKLYLNKSSNIYNDLKYVFIKFGETPTIELKRIYKELCDYYPDCNDFPDVFKYDDILHQKNIIVKVLIPVELSKRKKGKSSINSIIKIIANF